MSDKKIEFILIVRLDNQQIPAKSVLALREVNFRGRQSKEKAVLLACWHRPGFPGVRESLLAQ